MREALNNPLAEGKEIAHSLRRRLAFLVTELLNPPWVGMAILGVIAQQSTSGVVDFLKWWGLTAFFVIMLPFAFLLRGVRRGRFSDRFVTRASERMPLFFVAGISLLVCLAFLLIFEAPRPVIAVTMAVIAGLLVGMALTLRWKLSFHSGSVAGGVTVLTIAFGPWALPLVVLVPVVGWARVKIEHHTPAQVILGGVIGAIVTGATFGLISGL